MKVLIITDLDNTLYNWVDYFAPSFRGMVHALSKKSGVEEDLLIQEFRHVYNRHRSIEYSFSVQELNVFKDKSSEEIQELIKTAKGAFSRVRGKKLELYRSYLCN